MFIEKEVDLVCFYGCGVQLLQVDVLDPAVKGTLNVMKACHVAKVKRVVVVSSGAAVVFNPNYPADKLKDEICWSDKDYCRETKVIYNMYCFKCFRYS